MSFYSKFEISYDTLTGVIFRFGYDPWGEYRLVLNGSGEETRGDPNLGGEESRLHGGGWTWREGTWETFAERCTLVPYFRAI